MSPASTLHTFPFHTLRDLSTKFHRNKMPTYSLCSPSNLRHSDFTRIEDEARGFSRSTFTVLHVQEHALFALAQEQSLLSPLHPHYPKYQHVSCVPRLFAYGCSRRLSFVRATRALARPRFTSAAGSATRRGAAGALTDMSIDNRGATKTMNVLASGATAAVVSHLERNGV